MATKIVWTSKNGGPEKILTIFLGHWTNSSTTKRPKGLGTFSCTGIAKGSFATSQGTNKPSRFDFTSTKKGTRLRNKRKSPKGRSVRKKERDNGPMVEFDSWWTLIPLSGHSKADQFQFRTRCADPRFKTISSKQLPCIRDGPKQIHERAGTHGGLMNIILPQESRSE